MKTVPLEQPRMLLLLLTLLLFGAALSARAQTFNSGSSGADKAFAPTGNMTIQVPASGIFNYTTITIPPNVTITYIKNANARNLPVILLANSDVMINGTINVSGGNASNAPNGAGIGGPGGYDGGGGGGINAFGAVTYYGLPGDGPGGSGGGQASADGSGTILGGGGGGSFSTVGFTGGHRYYDGATATDGVGGPFYGATTLLQLVGGSGGGGGGSVGGQIAGGGGGGGGAILIASSGTINFGNSSAIYAYGGIGGHNNIGNYLSLNGGGGAGGAIRLVATTLTGSPSINVSGGRSGIDYYDYSTQSSGHGGNGFARFEAYQFNSFQPNVTGPFLSNLAPTSAILPNMPTLLIASVGGVSAPTIPKGDFNSPPDITLPSSATNQIPVVVQATNVPTGTGISVEMTPAVGSKTFTTSTLTGSSTATIGVNLPAALVSVLYAAATISLPPTQTGSLPPLIINGERVKRIQLATTFGGASHTTYVTESGRSYTREQLFGTLIAIAKKEPIKTLVKK